ncbi:MAG: hypothetical protein ASUL_03514 [Candidatus Aramenus sulfurataquae]|uniref:NurA domain-containing protein n=1 Tax=Candidatus Aramenus sulfurataquae TaxID=1326980 RepID=W7KMQ0_9CREN|nr:MAG: hypothetical protein ASUL_03514 [Candidatus Aramenus sulfurataquae]
MHSDPVKPTIMCSLVDDDGNERDILTITLEDNGIHVHKNLGTDDHYIVPPVPQVETLIREVIEEIAEELNVKAVVFTYGDEEEENTEDLVLSDEWYNIERLALAASKHTALSAEVDAKVVIGVVRFSNFIYSATVLRKEDTFPLLQVYMDSSSDVPLIRIYNELGQLIEERHEKVEDFEEYVKSLVTSNEIAVVYREEIESFPSPKEVVTENGSTFYVGVIFKYFLGFLPSSSIDDVKTKKIYVKNKSELAKLLRAVLYLDKLSSNGGVEVLVPSYAVPLNEIPKEIERLKQRAVKLLKRYKVNAVNFYGVKEPLLKELFNYKPKFENGEVYLGIRVIPVAFVIMAQDKGEFEEYVERILNGPTSDGYEILDEAIKKYVSSYFVGYLMDIEETLIIYSDIINEMNKDGK